MADSNRVRGSIAGDCEGGERGKRGHRGPAGPGFDTVPTPAFALSTTTIYANPNGSDKHGDGSAHKPFATFQEAVRHVPLMPARGARFIIDITGLGTEVLPLGYCLPQITFPVLVYGNDTSVPWFYSGAGLCLRANPKPASTIPSGDAVIDGSAGAVISEDPDTKLITLTITNPPLGRSSWNTANLRNKQVIRTVGSYFANCVIVDATNTTLVLTNNADNFNGAVQGNGGPAVGPLFLQPGEVLQIVEPSATLQTDPSFIPNDITGFDQAAGMQSTVNSIAWQGIKLTQPGSGFPVALMTLNCPQAPMELCDVEGVFFQGQAGTYWDFANGCVMRAAILPVNSSFFAQACHFDGLALFYMPNATPQSFAQSIFSDCASITNAEQSGLPILMNVALNQCLLSDSAGDAIFLREGRVQLQDVKIDNATGNAVHLAGANSIAGLVHVTGVVQGDYGVLAEDGAQASVDPTTTVTGTTGAPSTDTKSGSLAATTYGQVLAGLAFDIFPTAPVADMTGTRIFIKP